jgi:hypothetical protein
VSAATPWSSVEAEAAESAPAEEVESKVRCDHLLFVLRGAVNGIGVEGAGLGSRGAGGSRNTDMICPVVAWGW